MSKWSAGSVGPFFYKNPLKGQVRPLAVPSYGLALTQERFSAAETSTTNTATEITICSGTIARHHVAQALFVWTTLRFRHSVDAAEAAALVLVTFPSGALATFGYLDRLYLPTADKCVNASFGWGDDLRNYNHEIGDLTVALQFRNYTAGTLTADATFAGSTEIAVTCQMVGDASA